MYTYLCKHLGCFGFGSKAEQLPKSRLVVIRTKGKGFSTDRVVYNVLNNRLTSAKYRLRYLIIWSASAFLARGTLTLSNWSPKWTTFVATKFIRPSNSWKFENAACIKGETLHCTALTVKNNLKTIMKLNYSWKWKRNVDIQLFRHRNIWVFSKPPTSLTSFINWDSVVQLEMQILKYFVKTHR